MHILIYKIRFSMNRIFFLILSFCCLITTVNASKRTKRHRQFQNFVIKTSKEGRAAYSVSSAFKSEYDKLLDQGTSFVNALVADVSARELNLRLRSNKSNEYVMEKGKNGLIYLGCGAGFFGLGLYSVLHMKNHPSDNYSLWYQGFSWAGVIVGSKHMYSGVQKLYKSMFFNSIINDQYRRECALHDALKHP